MAVWPPVSTPCERGKAPDLPPNEGVWSTCFGVPDGLLLKGFQKEDLAMGKNRAWVSLMA